MSTAIPFAPTYAELVTCQLRIWPDSRIMWWHELLDILQREQGNIDWQPILSRTLNAYPNAVPYACGKDGKFRGIRFGLDGSQYVSF